MYQSHRIPVRLPGHTRRHTLPTCYQLPFDFNRLMWPQSQQRPPCQAGKKPEQAESARRRLAMRAQVQGSESLWHGLKISVQYQPKCQQAGPRWNLGRSGITKRLLSLPAGTADRITLPPRCRFCCIPNSNLSFSETGGWRSFAPARGKASIEGRGAGAPILEGAFQRVEQPGPVDGSPLPPPTPCGHCPCIYDKRGSGT